MNLFGAFNFGRLIKTFLPGFIFLIATLGYIAIFNYYLAGQEKILAYCASNPVLFIGVSIPTSIILGIFSNIVFFTYGTTRLIREKHEKKNRDFYKFKNKIYSSVKEYFANKFTQDHETNEQFYKNCDVEYLLFRELPLDKLVFLQESYWYYLEFQINIYLGVWYIFPLSTMILWSFYNKFLVIPDIIFFMFLLRLLISSARLNYDKHQRKHLSLLISNFYSMEL